MRPLHQLLRKYDNTRKIEWDDISTQAFEKIKHEINHCQKLYFLDDKSPIFVATDASEYGIGAICYQEATGQLVPIALMSHALSEQECRWNTTEKECYAIIYAFKKFEYLIRDRRFTLMTDHKALIYVDSEVSPKVRRWKIAIQSFDCDVVHVAGRNNVVADGFSRLLYSMEVVNWMQETVLWVAESDIPSMYAAEIEKMHNEYIGHHGEERTYKLLRRANKGWEGMRDHVRKFIKACKCCQKMSYLKVPIVTQKFTLASYEPFERINIDTIGPLPASAEGYNNILVIVDCFTRWITLYPMKDQTMANAKRQLLWHFGHFGVPSKIVHDGGPQFDNKEIEELFSRCGAKDCQTLAYSKEENGIVERANREVMRHLRNVIFQKNTTRHWEEDLGMVMNIMNSQSRRDGFPSPAQLLFGNAVRLNRHLIAERDNATLVENQQEVSRWADDMLERQRVYSDLAMTLQKAHDKLHLAKQGPQVTEFTVGDYVLARYHSTVGALTHRGPPSKFLPNLRGPFLVVGRDIDTYVIRSLVTKKDEAVHVTLLSPYICDPDDQEALQEAALRDHQDTYVVEAILTHRGNLNKRKEIEFKVRWLGYGPEGDTWELYSRLRSNALLHDYLRAGELVHGRDAAKLRALIPNGFRE